MEGGIDEWKEGWMEEWMERGMERAGSDELRSL